MNTFAPTGSSLYSLRIPKKVGKLSCILYPAGKNHSSPTIIFAHGFPGHEKNVMLAHLLRQMGFHVLIFYYSGSWGSDGLFSFSGSIDDTEAIIDFVMSDTQYHFDKEHVFLLGHSFGAPVIARAMERRPSIFGGIFLMPYDLGHLFLLGQTTASYRHSLIDLLKEGEEFIPHTSYHTFYEEIQSNPSYYSYFPLANMLSQKPLCWISCKRDLLAPESIHTIPFMKLLKQYPSHRITWKRYNTDHYFSNIHEQLANEITRFIQQEIEHKDKPWLVPHTFKQQLQELIEKEYKTISSERAAEYFHISEPYFCSIVKKQLHMTFHQFILTYKISMAKKQLRTSLLPITVISTSLGYANISYFEKVFKKYTGLSPGEYRKHTNSQL